jgi:ribosome-binding protein aMBF1 (putative translation factor)
LTPSRLHHQSGIVGPPSGGLADGVDAQHCPFTGFAERVAEGRAANTAIRRAQLGDRRGAARSYESGSTRSDLPARTPARHVSEVRIGESTVSTGGDGQERFLRLVGERVRVSREAAGFSQARLERDAVLRPTTIAELERGEHDLELCDLYRVAGVLGVDVRGLLPADGEPDEERAG